MDNLYFTALTLALIYYFFYLPSPKKSNANLPPQQNKYTQTSLAVVEKETQTETDELNKTELIKSLKADIQQKERTIIGLNNSYEKLETKKDEKIRSLETEKQKLLESVNFFTKNKELIKEAVEFHLNQASSFTTETHHPYLDYLKNRKKELQNLTEELEEYDEQDDEALKIRRRINECQEALETGESSLQAFEKQKVKNEKIVNECKELLEKLKDYE